MFVMAPSPLIRENDFFHKTSCIAPFIKLFFLPMALPATAPAPTEAGPHAPRALPGPVEAWLYALLTALLWRLEPIAHLLPETTTYPADELDEATRRWVRATIRRANRIRAWIGWILRFKPGRGMRRTFARLAPQPPLRPPRAPPPAA
jgi:hypothetical protein